MACWHRATLPIIGSLLMLGGAVAAPLELADAQDQLVLLNSNLWKTGEVERRSCLILHTAGEQRPPVRRPAEFALFKSAAVGQFTVEAATLEPDSVINRDICLIFGYQDDTHFYYAHISSNSDNKVHNVIMRVDGDSRVRINRETDPEARLSRGWTPIRIQQLENGAISVFVDDLETPLMTANDATYPIGKIGFGAFDDRAAFATLTVE
ncbi:hypothetical protein P4C99_09725 [Pontiellaceae bacterium B1224]|nr:hypothetical protein [Pontiellaceae bacterium B1224]